MGLLSCTGEGKQSRRNGWSCPWHPQQVLAWVFIAVLSVVYFGFFVFYAPLCWVPVMVILPGIVFLLLLISIFMATSINPQDEKVRITFKESPPMQMAAFDRSKHAHVIEDYRCYICQSPVSEGTKHCRACNKCISHFDHHCKWLNNCIGQKNYKWFIAAVSSALSATVSLCLVSVIYFILYFASRDAICYLGCGQEPISDQKFGNGTVELLWNQTRDVSIQILGQPVPNEIFPTVTAIVFVLTLISSILLAHLLIFHVYLKVKGLTTYDYIMLHRSDHAGEAIRNKNVKRNQVKPIDCESTDLAGDSRNMQPSDSTPQSAHTPESV